MARDWALDCAAAMSTKRIARANPESVRRKTFELLRTFLTSPPPRSPSVGEPHGHFSGFVLSARQRTIGIGATHAARGRRTTIAKDDGIGYPFSKLLANLITLSRIGLKVPMMENSGRMPAVVWANLECESSVSVAPKGDWLLCAKSAARCDCRQLPADLVCRCGPPILAGLDAESPPWP